MTTLGMLNAQTAPAAGVEEWTYEEAFARNLGLITATEQERLRTSRVAIAGMGGVGGVHLVTLARLGVGRFTIADPDVFEVANVNRQYGATCSAIGRGKADVMAQVLNDVNPEAEVRVVREPIGPDNALEFVEGADLLVDGLDFFAIGARRTLFRAAAASGIYAITAGPVGFSTAWLVLDPDGMSLDRYLDVHDQMSNREQLIAFAVGLAPRAIHLAYMDLGQVDVGARTAPSAGLACQLAAGVVGAEAVKILLGRGPRWPVPYYQQFDPFAGRFVRGRLRRGNRSAVQRAKRWWLGRRVR
jgi:molybdopterin/thiamine biosynthesis adenylyltransferase